MFNVIHQSSFDWDSRASNLATSGPEYPFYPDYDVGLAYNLDDLPPVLEDEQGYYSNQLQQHPQQQQQMDITMVPDHVHHHNQLQQQQQQQQLQHHQQMSNTSATYVSHQLQQHQAQQSIGTNPPASSFSTHLDNNLIYQQIQNQNLNEQQMQLDLRQHQLQTTTRVTSGSISGDHLDQDEHMGSIDHDMQMSSAGSTSSGRNEQRRVCHINAEQKRRCNIKNGFDTLRSILPSVNQNVNFKISKASMLQKAAAHISNLTSEQKQQAEEKASLKKQIETLKQTISNCQAQLPASGSCTGGQSAAGQATNQAREMLKDYIRSRTMENWKFWVFSLFIERLFNSYYQTVNTISMEETYKTMSMWLDQSCGLSTLRNIALEACTFLSTNTNILQTPHTLKDEAIEAIRYPSTSPQAAQKLPQLPEQQSYRPYQIMHSQHFSPAISKMSPPIPIQHSPVDGGSMPVMALSRQQNYQTSIQQQLSSHQHLQQAQFQHAQSFQAIQLTSLASTQQTQSLQQQQNQHLQHQQQQQQQQQQHQQQQHTMCNPSNSMQQTQVIRTGWNC